MKNDDDDDDDDDDDYFIFASIHIYLFPYTSGIGLPLVSSCPSTG